jgi:acetyl-CoA carboxylase biotin carboxyl carrier protein
MNIEEICRIAALMEKHDLSEFSVESEDVKLAIKRKSSDVQQVAFPQQFMAHPMQNMHPHAAAPQPQPSAPEKPAEAPTETPAEPNVLTVNSPIVGTFYRSPSPDADVFVKVGDRVSEDSVVCIVEAMKVMNEIKAEQSGVIKKVLVENASPVEFGQPLFELEPES